MKNSIVFAALIVASTPALADGLQQFVGRYKIVRSNCHENLKRGHERVYINQSSQSELTVRFYGSEARMTSLEIGRRVVPNPNHRHGNPVKEIIIEGRVEGRSLETKETYVLGNGARQDGGRLSLSFNGNKLFYFEGNGRIAEFCELVRN